MRGVESGLPIGGQVAISVLEQYCNHGIYATNDTSLPHTDKVAIEHKHDPGPDAEIGPP